MAKLKDRHRSIPNGFRFYQPETRWEPPRYVSFSAVVDALLAHRRGLPFLAQQHHWALDRETVENEVDAYNSKLCLQMGWNDFVMEGSAGSTPLPFPHPQQHLNRLRNVAVGGSLLVEWLKDGAEAVPYELSAKRAETCAACPKNGQGDWTRWFTVPVSEAIRMEVNRRREMKLSTPSDDKLGVCEACLCPLKLKVHMPIERVLKNISPETKAVLHPSCWILSEDGPSKSSPT